MISTAVILAGGFGTRLQSVVNDVPKPMAPINGVPFLNFQLKYLQHYGVTKVILSVGHLADVVMEYYKKRFENIEIEYAVEKSPLGTGGATLAAFDKCAGDDVLVL